MRAFPRPGKRDWVSNADVHRFRPRYTSDPRTHEPAFHEAKAPGGENETRILPRGMPTSGKTVQRAAVPRASRSMFLLETSRRKWAGRNSLQAIWSTRCACLSKVFNRIDWHNQRRYHKRKSCFGRRLTRQKATCNSHGDVTACKTLPKALRSTQG